ncbi:MAG: hypothetical protein NWP80_01100 [Candidatus Gracilibacteria bacterium]|nr:hypothetical protein [Candidatus Gracilibacteria bacterium]
MNKFKGKIPFLIASGDFNNKTLTQLNSIYNTNYKLNDLQKLYSGLIGNLIQKNKKGNS